MNLGGDSPLVKQGFPVRHKVVISGGAVSDIAVHFLNKYKILVLKISSKFELRRFCKTVGATSIIRSSQTLNTYQL